MTHGRPCVKMHANACMYKRDVRRRGGGEERKGGKKRKRKKKREEK